MPSTVSRTFRSLLAFASLVAPRLSHSAISLSNSGFACFIHRPINLPIQIIVGIY
jgi:hypothetical protein